MLRPPTAPSGCSLRQRAFINWPELPVAKRHIYKRFIRNPEHKPFRIQPKDLQLLKLLADYRFLTTYQILALQPRGIRNLRRRLQFMFHSGLVDRPPMQHHYLQPQGPIVYGLGKKGADLLAEKLEMQRGKIDWQAKNREARFPYIEHTLMISNFRATLFLALRHTKNTDLITWRQGPEIKAFVLLDGQRVAVIPDGFFSIEQDGRQSHFFLEVDRSTMSQRRLLRKMQAYWQWWKDGGHLKSLGIPRFRVLTLTVSEKRKENLRKLARDADERKQGSPMFLFACEKQFSLGKPQSILRPIWQSPVNDKWHSILA